MNSPAPRQAFCGNLRSIVITYEYVCERLSTFDIEASMGPDDFHPKLLSSCQRVAYPIHLIFKKSLICSVVDFLKSQMGSYLILSFQSFTTDGSQAY